MENKTERIAIRVYPHFYKRIKRAIEFLNVKQTDFITTAIAEKLNKIEKEMDKPLE